MKLSQPVIRPALLMAALLGGGAVSAQEIPADSTVPPAETPRTLDQKIDRMGGQVDDIHRDVKVIRRDLIESPLGNRRWGVEVNPLSILYLSEGLTFSGTLSNFSYNRSAEIAFPIYYSATTGEDESTLLNLDAQYRHFLGETQRGFYLSGFARYQHAGYMTIEDYFSEEDPHQKTLDRVGVGFGIGSRIFSRSGFYWGWNLSLGRFLVGDKVDEDELPNRLSLWTGDFIIDADLLKIGFAF